MKITSKQIHAMISFLTILMASCSGEEFTVLTMTKEGKQNIHDLLNEILQQQSDEIQEVKDE